MKRAEPQIISAAAGPGGLPAAAPTDKENADFDNANIDQIALRSLTDIALSEIFNNDLNEFMRINDLLEQTETLCPGLKLFNYNFQNRKRTDTPLRSFKTIVIQPAPDVLGDSLVANKALIEKRKAHGVQKAEQALQELMEIV